MPRPMIVLWLGMGCLAMSPCSAQQTPPIEPKTQQTPLPPPIEVPAPANLSNEVPNRPLSVEEAVKIALRKQPNVAIARAGLTAAQGRTQQARAGMMPTVALGGGYTRVESLNSTAGSGTGGTTGGVAP